MQSDKMDKPTAKAPSTGSKKSVKKKAEKKQSSSVEKVTKKAVKSATKKAAKKASPAKSATKASDKTKTGSTQQSTVKKKAVKKTDKIDLYFEVYFSTKFGESLLISGAHSALGAEAADQAPAMQYIDNQKWGIHLQIDRSSIKDNILNYTYILKFEEGPVTLSAPYKLSVPRTATSIIIRDSWNAPGYVENALVSNAIQELSEQTTLAKPSPSKKKFTHRFMITAPALTPGKAVCLIGQDATLGAWDPAKAIVLQNTEFGQWQTDLNLKQTALPTAYKYGIYDLENRQLETYETGENRILEATSDNAALVISQDGFIRTN